MRNRAVVSSRAAIPSAPPLAAPAAPAELWMYADGEHVGSAVRTDQERPVTAVGSGILDAAQLNDADVPAVLERDALELAEDARRKLDSDARQGPPEHAVAVDRHQRPSPPAPRLTVLALMPTTTAGRCC
jgi:hypothetical protein